MIRNRYNYLTPSIQDTKGKKDALKAMAPLSKRYKQKAQTQLAFYENLHRAVIGPSATLTGRWRPDIDLRRMLTGKDSFFPKIG